MSPRLPPLPAQLEPQDSGLELARWNEVPGHPQQRRKPQEFEMAAVDRPEGFQGYTSAQPSSSQHKPETSHSKQLGAQSATDPSVKESFVNMLSSQHGNESAELSEPLSQYQPQTQSQHSVLDDMFPSIKKILPAGSADDLAAQQCSQHPKMSQQLQVLAADPQAHALLPA